MNTEVGNDTDAYAELYDRFWSPFPKSMARKLVELHESWAPSAKKTILDVGCGTGIVAAEMTAAEYRVIGVDHSAAMLRRAQTRLEGSSVQLLLADATDFHVSDTSAFAISTYDVPNYLRDMNRVDAYLSCVWQAVDAGGLFVFDMLTSKGILDSNTIIVKDDPDALLVVRGAATADEALLRISGALRSADGTVQLVRGTEHSWSHPVPSIVEALNRSGWIDVQVVNPEDLNSPLDDPEQSSRVVFIAQRAG